MAHSKRLKILQVGKFYPPQMGGIETHLQALSRALSKHAEVRVLVANHGPSTQIGLFDEIHVTRVGTKATVASTPLCPSMPRYLRASDADLIHIHLPNPTAVLSYLAATNGRKVVVTYHSDTVRQRYLYAALKPFQESFLARSAAIIATSSAYLATSPSLQLHRKRCHVIPYGIPSDHFAPPNTEEVAKIRAKQGPRIVLAVGRLVYYKGFEYLIRSMGNVDGRLLLIGEGPLMQTLRTLATICGVSDRVTFLGDIKNHRLLPYYHAADIFVLPSVARSEAFGIVQLEAMAAGKPVINTLLDSGVPTVSLDRVTGLTVPPADSGALAKAINCLLDNRELRLGYGRAARARALSEFNAERMAAKTLQVYESVLSLPLMRESSALAI